MKKGIIIFICVCFITFPGCGARKGKNTNVVGESASVDNLMEGVTGGIAYGIEEIQKEETLEQTDYYVVTVTENGGYQVLVHEEEFAYGAELLREYLANMDCKASHVDGGCLDEIKDQYRCYVEPENIYAIQKNENNW